jgi:hypothetical protein
MKFPATDIEFAMQDEIDTLKAERTYYRDMWLAQRVENENFRKQLGLVAVSDEAAAILRSTTPTDAPLTVEEIDVFEERLTILFSPQDRDDPNAADLLKLVCAAARRAVSQEGGEQIYPSAVEDYVMRNAPPVSVERERELEGLEVALTYPDTPQSVPACTCTCNPLWDGYDGDCPIHGWFEPATPDAPLFQGRAEKEKLLEEVEHWKDCWNIGTDANQRLAATNAPLVERVSVLEVALNALLEHSFADECQECGIGQSKAWSDARAALRTSEGA